MRNYEVQNDVIHGLPHLSAPPQPTDAASDDESDDADDAPPKLPHASLYKTKPKFEQSGEPVADDAHEAEEPNPHLNADDHWTQSDRAPWQLHSGFGPNANPEARIMHFSPLEAVVNPPDFNYSENECKVSLDDARAAWEVLGETANQYTDASLSRDQLGDDFQQLFLHIVLAHVQALIDAELSSSMLPVKPLRLLLLGTAGTGKTTTVQTTLQEINNVLARHGLPSTFYRVATPAALRSTSASTRRRCIVSSTTST